jgi:hypothetical protein
MYYFRFVLFLLYIVFVCCQFTNNPITEPCDSFVPPSAETTTFLYTDSFKPCPDSEFAVPYQLNCSNQVVVDTYLRAAFRTATGAANASYSQFQMSVQYVAAKGTDCLGALQSSDTIPCGDIPCDQLATPVDIGVISSRAYVEYSLEFIQDIPFSWFPINNNSASVSPTCTGLSTCTCTDADPTNTEPCSITDTINIAANCGPNSDPNTGYAPSPVNQVCSTICCQTCGSDGATQHRRFGVGPVCGLYSQSGAQIVVDIYLAVAESSPEGLQAYIEAKNAQVLQTFVASNINPDYSFEILGNVIRLYINTVYSGAQSNIPNLNGLVVICDYGNASTGMGAYNPYVTLNPVFNTTFAGKNFTITNPRYRTPGYDAPYPDLGAGKVPTQNSLAAGSSVFFINASMATLFASSTFNAYTQSQTAILSNYQIPPNNISSPPQYQSPAWWNANNGVPGWQLAGTPPVPLVPSPCQMSNSVNTYAMNYLAAVAGNGGDYEAAVTAAGDPSPYLLPNYRIDMPNWWQNEKKSLYFDISTVLTSSQPTYECFADIIGTVLSNDNLLPVPLVQIGSQSGCIANMTLGVGSAIAYVTNTNPQDIAALIDLDISCNYTLNGVIHAAVITPVSQEQLTINPGQTVTSTVFTITFSNQTTEPPICQFTGISTQQKSQIYPSPPFPCVVPLGPGGGITHLLPNGSIANGTGPSPPTSCGKCDLICIRKEGRLTESGCFWAFMLIMVGIALVLGIGTACGIISCCHRKNQKAQTSVTTSPGYDYGYEQPKLDE